MPQAMPTIEAVKSAATADRHHDVVKPPEVPHL
jgi:hypothetical protein